MISLLFAQKKFQEDYSYTGVALLVEELNSVGYFSITQCEVE